MAIYNPLDKKNLGTSVAKALLEQNATPLGTLQKFDGAGVYAIYYTGSFQDYAYLVAKNQNGKFDQPIYVGKAIPAGGRKGELDPSALAGPVLYNRLQEHAESIGDAKNLKLEDFFCRYLVVDDIWIPLGETLMITMFKPIWNVVVEGFGNHDPGAGRYQGARPSWDVYHPGRAWADKCQPGKKSVKELSAEVLAALNPTPIPQPQTPPQPTTQTQPQPQTNTPIPQPQTPPAPQPTSPKKPTKAKK